MTARRLAMNAHKSPELTRGDDEERPETPCERDMRTRRIEAGLAGHAFVGDHNPSPFDRLTVIKDKSHRALNKARREALELCDACPVREACWRENRDEEWLQRVASGRRQPGGEAA